MGGCCVSTPLVNDQPPPQQPQTQHVEPKNDEVKNDEPKNDGFINWPFTEFSLSDLTTATKNFSSDEIISENREESSNVVFKGLLSENLGFVAVKIFKITPQDHPHYFAKVAKEVGELKHKRLVKLLGYCSDGDEGFLVAEFMPYDTLAKRLFHQKNIEWSMRLRVAYHIAEALDYCNTAGFDLYSNLSAYTVLFDKDGDACLSSFGLVKGINDDQRTTGSVNPKNVTYRFGTILVNLISGKQIPPSHALEMILGKTLDQLMDPYLKGRISMDEATAVFKLATQCLQHEDQESPDTREIAATLETLLTRPQVPSHEVTAVTTQTEEASSSTHLSPLGEACSRMDLASIHQILVSTAYNDDNDLIESSFREWTEVQELQDVRKQGDQAFEEQDFKTAIAFYSQFIENRKLVYPSVYARRSLCYIFCNDPDNSLLDGMTAQNVYPDWPTALYLQSVALAKLNMNSDSTYMLKEAAILEAKRQQQ
ncbi:PREDICTED: probable inactive receptor-like kinase SSP [Camelina sativa]|uniref:Serine/threonine-protein kinase BSK n=1 Tax=Camelina sativa TaxID=90675 RepID=A0ABM0XSF9_CAMSA|nr:PREDICTED: probable inactive receptor-like kinase SSP [Camelina sativa]